MVAQVGGRLGSRPPNVCVGAVKPPAQLRLAILTEDVHTQVRGRCLGHCADHTGAAGDRAVRGLSGASGMTLNLCPGPPDDGAGELVTEVEAARRGLFGGVGTHRELGAAARRVVAVDDQLALYSVGKGEAETADLDNEFGLRPAKDGDRRAFDQHLRRGAPWKNPR